MPTVDPNPLPNPDPNNLCFGPAPFQSFNTREGAIEEVCPASCDLGSTLADNVDT
jgi:hypothetical protein